MGVNWTPEQKQAIETHTGSLLVSAAAGSGKTAVLVERIMQRILDDGDPRDIDEFLIVTYTNAAASEMRYKIAQAIENRLSENPGDRRLLRQLRLLNGAQVMTVHSFCLGFLREHFHLAGLAPDFRVADQSELEMLKESAIKTVLERAYDEMDQNPNFPKLVESFSGMRDDRAVEEVILGTFEKLQSHSFPDQWMEQVKKNFEPSERARIEDSEWGSYLLERAKNAIESGKRYLFSALDTINRFPVLQEKYGPSFDSDLTQFDSLLELIKKGSWDDAAAYAQDITFLKLGSVRKFEDEEALAQIKSSRDTAKKIIAAVQEKYLPKRSEEVGRELATVSLVVTELFRLVNKFDTEFSKAKRKRNLVDFSDLEHFTVSILCEEYHFETKTAKPSDAATSVASQFAEILVDEYQDTNEVQDLIFNLVSKSSKNLFMVGDVKQSIYRFRLADPSIFLQKYNAWPDVSDEADKNGARVILSKNFRSRKSVLDAVNFLFCALLKGGFGELIYSDKEKLYKGIDYDKDGDKCYQTELLLLDRKASEDTDGQEETEKAEEEAALVAMRIEEMLKTRFLVTDSETKEMRPVKPSDIVILLRSVTNKAKYFKNALAAKGIAASSNTEGGFFERTEILVMTALLSVVDNPRKDVELISVLRSPLYGFSEDELADIRLCKTDCGFYEAVLAHAEAGNEKCGDFLRELAEFRHRAKDMNVSRLLFHIYNKTGALGLFAALPPGRERERNLLTLFEYAEGFEKLSYKGLFAFLKYLDKIASHGEAKGQEENASDSVIMMSIHKSKGLEFPVVFLADCAKQFNEDDLRQRVLLHKKLGIGLYCRDEELPVEYPTLMRLAIEEKLRQEMLAEELRVLYVGMTRAKEKLILTMALPDVYESMKKCQRAMIDGKPDELFLSQQRSPAMWLLTPILCNKDQTAIRVSVFNRTDLSTIDKSKSEEKNREETAYDSEKIGQIINFHYPYPKATVMPSKITPSSLEPDSNKDTPDYEESGFRLVPKPDFLDGDRPLSRTERGIAHHLVMQFIDFSRFNTLEDIKEELNRLEQKRFLSKAQKDAVDPGKIMAFFRSSIGRRLMQSDCVRREFRFSILIKQDELFEISLDENDDSEFLLQGVIDCMFEEDGELVVLDFKTDRLKNRDVLTIAERYQKQIEAYAYAMHRITGKRVKETVLWFFDRDAAISVERKD